MPLRPDRASPPDSGRGAGASTPFGASDEPRLRAILDAAFDAVIGMDSEGRIVYWNPSAAAMFGWSREEALGRALETVVMPERFRERHRNGLRHFLATGEGPVLNHRVELSGVRRDGREFPLELLVTAFREGAVWSFVAFVTDISERRASHDVLRASEVRFRALIEHGSDGIALASAEGVILYASPVAGRILGSSAEELVGRSFGDFIHPDDVPLAMEIFDWLLQHPGESSSVTVRGGREGAWKQIQSIAVNHLEDPAVRALVANFRDVSAQIEADEGLRRSEARYRSMFESAPVGIYQATRDGRVIAANAELARILGYDSADEMLGLNMRDLYQSPEERESAIRSFEGSTQAADLELTWKRKDGSTVQVQLNAASVAHGEGGAAGFEGFVRDVTERVELEARLRQAQKMEAIGRLAGGIAHDFNNLLTAILGYSDLTLADLAPEHPIAVRVLEIRRAGERAAALTQQLLAFSRQQVLRPRVVDLNSVVADVLQMLGRLIGEHIELTTVLAPDLAPVRVDPHQIQQVIVNLAVNARDAMPDGGELRIETCNAAPDAEHPGPHVELMVKDTGVGIEPATLPRIFEPFFTTKMVGEGTGLGLSTVVGIVEQSGGFIRVRSEPGRGSAFQVFLPASDQAVDHERPDGAASAVARGVGTILVAEDEDTVRALVAQMLGAAGYRVIEARSPEHALALARAHHGRIDLLLTDLVMPDGGGRALTDRVRAERPGLPVVYMSGYSEDLARERGAMGVAAGFLQKPFRHDELLRAVHLALGDVPEARRL